MTEEKLSYTMREIIDCAGRTRFKEGQLSRDAVGIAKAYAAAQVAEAIKIERLSTQQIDRLVAEKDAEIARLKTRIEEIGPLNAEINAYIRGDYKQINAEIEALKAENERLKGEVDSEQVRNARLRDEIEALEVDKANAWMLIRRHVESKKVLKAENKRLRSFIESERELFEINPAICKRYDDILSPSEPVGDEPAPAVDENGLLPCPFCGGKAEPPKVKEVNTFDDAAIIECSKCGGQVEEIGNYKNIDQSKISATKSWNRRANQGGTEK